MKILKVKFRVLLPGITIGASGGRQQLTSVLNRNNIQVSKKTECYFYVTCMKEV